jgi:hypothetical protein
MPKSITRAPPGPRITLPGLKSQGVVDRLECSHRLHRDLVQLASLKSAGLLHGLGQRRTFDVLTGDVGLLPGQVEMQDLRSDELRDLLRISQFTLKRAFQ